jgi:predicted nucleic acid-binding protein
VKSAFPGMNFMKDAKVFVDTNIVVYAYDVSASGKHVAAADIMKDLWNTGEGIVSTQVLQEFFVTITKKVPHPLDTMDAKEIVRDLLRWKTVVVDGETVLEAIDIHRRRQYSFWDSLIIASAMEGGAATLLSEDLSHGELIKGIHIVNPFKETR